MSGPTVTHVLIWTPQGWHLREAGFDPRDAPLAVTTLPRDVDPDALADWVAMQLGSCKGVVDAGPGFAWDYEVICGGRP